MGSSVEPDVIPSAPDGGVTLDRRLLDWASARMLADAEAKLIEGGADGDTRILLSEVFVDLKARHVDGRCLVDVPVVRFLCDDARITSEDDDDGEPAPRDMGVRRAPRLLLTGGPGAGKSTLTSMAAQVLRARLPAGRLPTQADPGQAARVRAGIEGVATALKLAVPVEAYPVRVSLPSLARWMASQAQLSAHEGIWLYLATECVGDLRAAGALDGELTATMLEALLRGVHRVAWFFDGLDEVPAGPGRTRVVAAIREVVARCRVDDRVVVTTRPQGYDGEFPAFGVLDVLPLDLFRAVAYARGLRRAWRADVRDDAVEDFQIKLQRPALAELASTPLHVTMLTLLMATQPELPEARASLYTQYFDVMFRREQRKLAMLKGPWADRGTLWELHARFGLALHVRAQAGAGARALLSGREVRGIVAAYLRELSDDDGAAQEHAEALVRFTTTRLVLLLRTAEGGFEFRIRSLQEFFAAVALEHSEVETVAQRLHAIARFPLWENVVALFASRLVLEATRRDTQERAQRLLVGVCEALDRDPIDGVTGAGARLALRVIEQTGAYARGALLQPLWEVALRLTSVATQEGASMRTLGTSNERRDVREVHEALGALAWERARGGDRRWYDTLLERAEVLLGGGRSERWIAWHLLNASLAGNEARTTELARRHLPHEAKEARDVLIIADGNPDDPTFSDVMVELVQSHPEFFSPGWIYVAREVWWPTRDDLPVTWRTAALLADVDCKYLEIDLLRTPSWTHATIVVLLKSPTDAWESIRALCEGNVDPVLHAWGTTACFHLRPDPGSLAALLDELRGPAWAELRRVTDRLAWPLAACLHHVAQERELVELAAMLRAGTLGTAEDWHRMEARWEESPCVDTDRWAAWVACTMPWDVASGEAPLVEWLPTMTGQSSLRVDRDVYLHGMFAAIEAHGSDARRALRVCETWLNGGIHLGPRPAVPFHLAARFRDVQSRDPHMALLAVNVALPNLATSSALWIDLLDERGRAALTCALNTSQGMDCAENLTFLVDQLSLQPHRWGLADVVCELLLDSPDAPLTNLRLSSPPSDMTARGIAHWSFLTVLTEDLPDEALRESLQRLVGHESRRFDYRVVLARILSERHRDPARSLRVLHALWEGSGSEDFVLRDTVVSALRAHRERVPPTAFATEEAWRAAKLPEPWIPMEHPTQAIPYLVAIEALTNLRVFRETPQVDVPLPTPAADQGQWIVLVGENGVGKTTLLRAIALALAPPQEVGLLLTERLPLVRNGEDATVAVTLPSGEFRVTLRGGPPDRLLPSASEPPSRPWVVGYGVRRGNARGEVDRAVDWSPAGNLHTLFDQPASLVRASQWLLDLDRLVLREQRDRQHVANAAPMGPYEATWNAVHTALKELLRVREVEIGDREVFVHHDTFGRVRLDALSDGYLTTTGWVIDLIARWVTLQDRELTPVGPDLLAQMRGVVLLDEIDLHLHPLWQLRIIDDVRRLFPRMTFVVTTHNPLALQGARPGEIYVVRADGGRIELTQRDIRPGHDVDRVLLEQFGVKHTLDRESRELLDAHSSLVAQGISHNDPRRKAFEAKIMALFGGLGPTLRDERNARDSSPLRPEELHLLDRFPKRS